MRKLLQVLLACLAFIGMGTAVVAAQSNPAASLRAEYAALGRQLSNNQFQRPLHLASAQSGTRLEGELYALVDHPFDKVSAALGLPANWCEVMILHINVKYCRAMPAATGTALAMRIGSKLDQPLANAYPLEFAYRVAAATADYLQVELQAPTGPLSTNDYRIVLKATPVDAGRTFLRFSYSYAYGMTGRLALQAYLATGGRDKVGFTITGRRRDGQPEYIADVRGLVERNTMRYYLAIDAYLGSLSVPAAAQFEKRISDWFAATERHARQLHEMDAATYLEMKRKEHRRQQTAYLP